MSLEVKAALEALDKARAEYDAIINKERAKHDKGISFIYLCSFCDGEREIYPPLEAGAPMCEVCGSPMHLDRRKGVKLSAKYRRRER